MTKITKLALGLLCSGFALTASAQGLGEGTAVAPEGGTYQLSIDQVGIAWGDTEIELSNGGSTVNLQMVIGGNMQTVPFEIFSNSGVGGFVDDEDAPSQVVYTLFANIEEFSNSNGAPVKGKYEVTIPQGTVRSVEDPSLTNEAQTFTWQVVESYFGSMTVTPEEGGLYKPAQLAETTLSWDNNPITLNTSANPITYTVNGDVNNVLELPSSLVSLNATQTAVVLDLSGLQPGNYSFTVPAFFVLIKGSQVDGEQTFGFEVVSASNLDPDAGKVLTTNGYGIKSANPLVEVQFFNKTTNEPYVISKVDPEATITMSYNFFTKYTVQPENIKFGYMDGDDVIVTNNTSGTVLVLDLSSIYEQITTYGNDVEITIPSGFVQTQDGDMNSPVTVEYELCAMAPYPDVTETATEIQFIFTPTESFEVDSFKNNEKAGNAFIKTPSGVKTLAYSSANGITIAAGQYGSGAPYYSDVMGYKVDISSYTETGKYTIVFPADYFSMNAYYNHIWSAFKVSLSPKVSYTFYIGEGNFENNDADVTYTRNDMGIISAVNVSWDDNSLEINNAAGDCELTVEGASLGTVVPTLEEYGNNGNRLVFQLPETAFGEVELSIPAQYVTIGDKKREYNGTANITFTRTRAANYSSTVNYKENALTSVIGATITWEDEDLSFVDDANTTLNAVCEGTDYPVTPTISGTELVLDFNSLNPGFYTLEVPENFVNVGSYQYNGPVYLTFTVIDRLVSDVEPEVTFEYDADEVIIAANLSWNGMALGFATTGTDLTASGTKEVYTLSPNDQLTIQGSVLNFNLVDLKSGDYTVVIPKGYILLGDEYINSEYILTFNIKELLLPDVPDEPTLVGGATAVEIVGQEGISGVSISWSDAIISLNPANNEMVAVESDTAINPVVNKMSVENNNLVVTFNEEFMENATFTVIIPEGIVYVGEGALNEEETLTLQVTVTGVASIGNDGELVRIYNLNGVRMNVNKASELPAGIYIVNGKKVVVK